jgi:LPS-assembly lipoprotein
MWWSETPAKTGITRRTVLAGLGGLPLAACGFTPVYGPGGAGGRLLGEIALPDPGSPLVYLYDRRIEERLGRGGPGASYVLRRTLSVDEQTLGGTSAGATTRYRLLGEARFVLRDAATDRVLISDTTTAFTGYSSTGSTVATLAAERDARDRLAVLLADQTIDILLLQAAGLPG